MIRICAKNMAFGGDMNDFMLRISFHISFKSSRLKPITELLMCVYYPNFHVTATAHINIDWSLTAITETTSPNVHLALKIFEIMKC